MNVQPISLVSRTNNYNRISSRQKTISQMPNDNVSFTNYSAIIEKASAACLERESHVERYFSKLMQSIWTDNSMLKSEKFSTITDIYSKKGLRNMLMDFWKPNPSEKEIQSITQGFDDGTLITLVERPNDIFVGNSVMRSGKSEPVVQLVQLGKHGFWNNITNSKDAPRDVRILFKDKNSYLELSLDKIGDLTVMQGKGNTETMTSFHALTGHRKLVVVCPGEGKPEFTYYNKNGTRAFWKNLIFGGIPTEGIY